MTTNHPYYYGPPPEPQPEPQPEPVDAYGYTDPYGAYAQYPGYGAQYYAPPAAPVRRRGWRLGAGVAALTAAALVGGIAIGDAVSGGTTTVAGSGSDAQAPQQPGSGVLPGGGTDPGADPGTGGGNGSSTSVALANAAQKVGVVTIVSTLRYQNSQSAGTGMVLTSDGEVLTNNHVVNGATSLVVTVVSTGKSYRADVVGTDPSDDVAVVQLRKASGLATAKLASSASGVKVGDTVVGVGNAGGTGTLRASRGAVTALDQSITASDAGSGADAERLHGLIETNAPIIAGDSGGPLYDSAGKVVGIDTAASANPGRSAAYAIRIENAVRVAQQIESGHESATVHIGPPAFLGVSIDRTSRNGALVTRLLPGGPAAGAGITGGSTITAVGSSRVATGTALRTVLQKYQPGDRVTITWTDAGGTSHSTTVTLAAGPAD